MTYSRCTPIERAVRRAAELTADGALELLVGVKGFTQVEPGRGPVNALAPATKAEHTIADFMLSLVALLNRGASLATSNRHAGDNFGPETSRVTEIELEEINKTQRNSRGFRGPVRQAGSELPSHIYSSINQRGVFMQLQNRHSESDQEK